MRSVNFYLFISLYRVFSNFSIIFCCFFFYVILFVSLFVSPYFRDLGRRNNHIETLNIGICKNKTQTTHSTVTKCFIWWWYAKQHFYWHNANRDGPQNGKTSQINYSEQLFIENKDTRTEERLFNCISFSWTNSGLNSQKIQLRVGYATSIWNLLFMQVYCY